MLLHIISVKSEALIPVFRLSHYHLFDELGVTDSMVSREFGDHDCLKLALKV